MLFALWDYATYRLRRGRYGQGVGSSALSLAYENVLPDDVIAQLERGDVILTQRMNSVWSWGTMYFASAFVDHAATYLGDGTVHHMTLGGERTHRVNVVAKGARTLPARLNAPLGDEHFLEGVDTEGAGYEYAARTLDGGYVERGQRMSHLLPPKLQLVFIALRIMTGHYIERYRWWFSADIALLALLIDAALYYFFGWFVATPIAGLMLLLTGWNVAKWTYRKRTNKGYEILSHPDLFLRNLNKYGGIIFTSLGPLSLSEIGVLPLHVFLSLQNSLGLGGEGADDGADD